MKAEYDFCCLNIKKIKTPLSGAVGKVGKGTMGRQPINVQKMQLGFDKKIDIAPISDRESLISHTLWMFSQV